MGVVYIGDRATGKTYLVTELTNPLSNHVKVSNQEYEYLKTLLVAEDGTTRTTQTILDRFLEVQVRLPTGLKLISVDWIDTPGEIWRKTWQSENRDQWKNFLEIVKSSEGILLILPPYREMLPFGVDAEDYMIQQQWCNRFNRWVEFFRQDCPKVRHLVVCLNKADLFCDIKQEGLKLAYNPNGAQLNWQQRHSYVFQKYFRPIQPQLEQMNKIISGLSVRCFITTIYNRSLLELPWIYLGSFLAK